MPVSPATVAYTTAGGILLYSGLTGDTVGNTLRTLLKGQKPSGTTTQPQVAVATNSSGATYSVTATSPNGLPPIVKGSSSGSAASNQALARMLAVSLGHPSWATGQEWSDWVALWNQESGWSTTALNHTSGATGIPQLLPSAHAIPPGWSSATVQITWGINYIAGRYGDPVNAWAHEQANGWY